MTSTPPQSSFRNIKESDAALVLAFIGGYVDAAGYLKLLTVFTSSITGNLVVAAASVAQTKGALCRSMVCIAFVLAGALSSVFSLKFKLAYGWAAKKIYVFLYSLELIALIASLVVGLELDNIITSTENMDTPAVILVGCILSASMGFHNVAAKESITNCPPTTVMTSTLITVSQNASNTISYFFAKNNIIRLSPLRKTEVTIGGTSDPETSTNTSSCCNEANPASTLSEFQKKFDDSLNKFIVSAKPLLSFTVGAIIGGIAMAKGTFWCILGPIILVLLLIVDIILQVQFEENAKNKAAAATTEFKIVNTST